MRRELDEAKVMNQRKEEEWKLEREDLLKQLVEKKNQVAEEHAKVHTDLSKKVEYLKDLLIKKTTMQQDLIDEVWQNIIEEVI